MKKMSRQEKSWILYDWANSVYSLVITTALFPIYFKAAAKEAGLSGATSTAYWGYANSFATLLISILAPIPARLLIIRDLKNDFSHSSLDSVSYLQVC